METKEDIHGHAVVTAEQLGRMLPRMLFKVTLTRTPGFDEGLPEEVCVDDIELLDLKPDYRQADAQALWSIWVSNRNESERWRCYDCGAWTTTGAAGKPRCAECTERLVS